MLRRYETLVYFSYLFCVIFQSLLGVHACLLKPYIPLLGGIHIKYNRYSLAYMFDPTGEHLFCMIQILSKNEIIMSQKHKVYCFPA